MAGRLAGVAAAFANPGMAAWKSILWEGELVAGQTVLVLGATGTSGRIATQLAKRHGARVIACGRNQRVLDDLVARGADAVIRVDCAHDELAAAIAAQGPYDLIVDYLWGAPAEALFAALIRTGSTPAAPRSGPAMALRAAPVQLFGSGIGGSASLADSAAAYGSLLQQVAAGEIILDADPVPLAHVEKTWQQGDSDRRIVFVP